MQAWPAPPQAAVRHTLVWNAAAPGIICVAAGATMLTSGWSIYKEAKKLKD